MIEGTYKYSILIVDDEQGVLKLMVRYLEQADLSCKVLVANNGKVACTIAEKTKPDLIIMDWEMPIMTGIEAVENLKTERSTRDIPIIMATALASPERLKEAFSKGVVDYIAKPIHEIELIARVNSILRVSDSYQEIKRQNKEIKEQHNKLLEAQTRLVRQADALKEANEEIVKQKEIIEAQTKDILESIGYAKHIQSAMLPFEEKIENSLPEHFILFKPRDVVSGDFYWFAERNYKTIIAAVDCTGHGVPGAFMSMIGNELLNQIVNWQGVTEPQNILNELHKGVRRVLKQEETGNFDGMDLAICVIDNFPKDFISMLGNPKLEYAGAHNPLLLIQNNELQLIKGDRFAVGGYLRKEEQFFTKHTFDIFEKDTILYIFSDGFQDQFNGKDNMRFKIRRLKDLLFDIHQKKLSEQKQTLEETLDTWMTDEEGQKAQQMDDILLIGVRLRNNNFTAPTPKGAKTHF